MPQQFKIRDLRKKEKFKGFPKNKQTWDFPIVINGWVDKLSGSEFKVLWYIVRHTFGWQKTSDKISYKQFKNGIIKRNGEIVDCGTGLETQAIREALKNLEAYGFIKSGKKRNKGRQGITEYRVVYKENTDFENQNQGGGENQNQTDFENQKETIPNNITILNLNNSNAAGIAVNDLIEKFKTINPSYKKFFSNKTQRSALERLIKQHGFNKVVATIDFLPQIQGQRYAPVITTPLQLEDKLAQLISYKLKEDNKKPTIVKIS